MYGSMSFMRTVPEINNFIASLDNPFLLLVIGAVIFTVLLLIWKGFSETLIESWITSKEWQICAFYTIFNCTSLIVLYD